MNRRGFVGAVLAGIGGSLLSQESKGSQDEFEGNADLIGDRRESCPLCSHGKYEFRDVVWSDESERFVSYMTCKKCGHKYTVTWTTDRLADEKWKSADEVDDINYLRELHEIARQNNV